MSAPTVTVSMSLHEARALTRGAEFLIEVLGEHAGTDFDHPVAIYTARGKLETAVAIAEATA